jgi:hypothetical protein
MLRKVTMGLDPPLSFVTAPPDVDGIVRSRFREPRNLPYSGAPAYKASLYYWWWAFLKRNKSYWHTCQTNGQGILSNLYNDFGNIFDVSFDCWWSRHKQLFAEQSTLMQPGDPLPTSDQVWYLVDPRKSFNQIQEEMRVIHMQAHAIMPADGTKLASSAKYPIYTNVSAHTLHKVLKIWDLKQINPTKSAYQLGELAGLKANFLPPPKFGETRTRSAIDAVSHNKRARIAIANHANRYLRTAAQYIENVGMGIFPKAERR